MRPHMVPNAYLLKLLFLARYTSRSIYILSISTNIVLPTYFLDLHCYNILHLRRIFFPSFLQKLKNPYTMDEYSQKLNERKILTVLRRNSIISVNCSTEYIYKRTEFVFYEGKENYENDKL